MTQSRHLRLLPPNARPRPAASVSRSLAVYTTPLRFCSNSFVLLLLVLTCLVLTCTNLNLKFQYVRVLDQLAKSREEIAQGLSNRNVGADLERSWLPLRRNLLFPRHGEQQEAGGELLVQGEDGLGQTQFQEHGLAPFMFVRFSVHPISPTTVSVLGLTPGIMQNMSRSAVDACEWEYPGNSLPSLRVKVQRYRKVWFGETYRLTYSPLFVHCEFDRAIDRDLGGKLFLNVSTFSPLEGDYIRVQALEAAPQALPLPTAFQPPFQYEYALCSAPIYRNVSAKVVRQWLAYHFAMFEGKVHFVIYDAGGVDATLLRVFRPYAADGFLSVIDVQEGSRYEAWYHHQVLAINHCFNAARTMSNWVLHFDFDEFLLPVHPRTLGSILSEHRDKPWVTFGSMPHKTELCATREADVNGTRSEDSDGSFRSLTEEHWEIEKAVMRRATPECWHPVDLEFICLGAHGRRKYAANPRRILNAGIHRVLDPETGGVHLNHRVAAFHHYRGIVGVEHSMCSKGQFKISSMKAWLAKMEHARIGASVPMPGVEDMPWKKPLPDVLDETVIQQARRAKTFAREYLLASADVLSQS